MPDRGRLIGSGTPSTGRLEWTVMRGMDVRFLGSGDTFGSGGRLPTCIHVCSEETTFLIDCGASSLIAMKGFGVDTSSIDTMVVTHLHGDHFGGIPFFVLDAQIVSRRTRRLTVAGPPGLEGRSTTRWRRCFP